MDIHIRKQIIEKFIKLVDTFYGHTVLIEKELARLFVFPDLFFGKQKAEESILKERSGLPVPFEGVVCEKIDHLSIRKDEYDLSLVIYQYTIPGKNTPSVYAIELERYRFELEYDDIAGYTPFGLEVICLDTLKKPFSKGLIVSAHNFLTESESKLEIESEGKRFYMPIGQVLPVLKPMSDFFKEKAMEILYFSTGRGFNYNPAIDARDIPTKEMIEFYADRKEKKPLNSLEMGEILRFCYRYQYDVHNLIRHNLAVDRNQLSIMYRKSESCGTQVTNHE